MIFKLFRGIEGTEYVMIDLERGLGLSYHLGEKGQWNMTIRTGCSDTTVIEVVAGADKLLRDIVSHFMTGGGLR